MKTEVTGSMSPEWQALLFTVIVTTVTSVWVYVGRNWSFGVLALAMFLPGFLSFFFTQQTFFSYLAQVLGIGRFQDALTGSAAGAVLAVAIVGSTLAIDLLLGWAHATPSDVKKSWKPGDQSLKQALMKYLAAAGEEVGWRCYLLPTLMSVYPPFTALTLCGVAWGLFHVPVMVVLTHRLKPPRPLLTVVVQGLSVLVTGIPNGLIAIKAGYSMWPSTTMHFVWNVINPKLLGSIYMQTPGYVTGQQWLINGEGLAGCIVQGVGLLCWFAYRGL